MKNGWRIEPENMEMCKWACVYLFRRFGMLFPRMMRENDYGYCTRVINQQKGNDRDNLLKNMQAAWRQKKYKKEQMLKGKVPCSFMLSASTLKNLDRLTTSFGETVNVTLESIINETYLVDKENKKQQLAKKQQLKKAAPATPALSYRERINIHLDKLRRQVAQGDFED